MFNPTRACELLVGLSAVNIVDVTEPLPGRLDVHNQDNDACSAKGLIGTDFEDWLVTHVNGEGAFKVSGREFDGKVGNRWLEAKSGRYWQDHAQPGPGFEKFKSDMGHRLRIARDNNATYELHSNTPIPNHVRTWLDSRDILWFEHLD